MLIALTPCCARTFLSACLWYETMSLCWLSYHLQSAVFCWAEVHRVLQLGREDVVVALQNTSVRTFFPLIFKKQKPSRVRRWEARKPSTPKAGDYKVVWMSSESYSLALVSFFLGSLMWLRLALNLFPPLLLHGWDYRCAQPCLVTCFQSKSISLGWSSSVRSADFFLLALIGLTWFGMA